MRYSMFWLHAGSYSTGAVVGAAAVAVFGTVAAQRPARTAQKADSGSSQVIRASLIQQNRSLSINHFVRSFGLD